MCDPSLRVHNIAVLSNLKGNAHGAQDVRSTGKVKTDRELRLVNAKSQIRPTRWPIHRNLWICRATDQTCRLRASMGERETGRADNKTNGQTTELADNN